MTKQAAVFKETYEKYLQDINGIDFREKAIMLGAEPTVDGMIIPFFNHQFLVSKNGVRGFDEKPSFALKVMLLKYVLMCPSNFPTASTSWIPFREFKDSTPLVSYFTNTTTLLIEEYFAENCSLLLERVKGLGGELVESPIFDISIKFSALPRIPLLLNYNGADDLFPASCSLLFRSTTENFIDMECLTITGTYLTKKLLKKDDEDGQV